MYRLFFRVVLRRIDPERAHALAGRALRLGVRIPGMRGLLGRSGAATAQRLQVNALGLTFPSPIGVAAGVDKQADWFDGLGALGFGFVEVGTITALPQPGNPRPRIFRLPEDRAIVNSMGFPNPGATAAAEALRFRRRGTLIGVNIGKSKVVADEDADADYRASVRELAPHCDYVAVNVSSPNTPGLRDMQSADRLRPLLAAVREEIDALGLVVPVLVKIAPDLSDEEIDAIADVALEQGLDGIIATNTTVDFGVLGPSRARAEEIGVGGVSGAPLAARSLEVLRRLRERVGDEMVLVSVGGVQSAADALQRIRAGATLVQLYTAFVYEGPLLARRINREIARGVADAGAESVAELVGADV